MENPDLLNPSSGRRQGASIGRTRKPNRVWADGLILALEALIALTSIPAGILLAVKRDGSMIRLPLELLKGSPFHSYLIPGLVLFLVVGGASIAAIVAVWVHSPYAYWFTLASSLLLMGWIIAQVLFIGYQGLLQPMVLSIGIILFALSWFQGGRVQYRKDLPFALLFLSTYIVSLRPWCMA
jgi:hypothetical protein